MFDSEPCAKCKKFFDSTNLRLFGGVHKLCFKCACDSGNLPERNLEMNGVQLCYDCKKPNPTGGKRCPECLDKLYAEEPAMKENNTTKAEMIASENERRRKFIQSLRRICKGQDIVLFLDPMDDTLKLVDCSGSGLARDNFFRGVMAEYDGLKMERA